MPVTTANSQSIRLIHLSLLAGVLIFLAVAHFARPESPPQGALRLDVILAVAAAPVLLLALVLRARVPARRASESLDSWWSAQGTTAIIVWSLIEGASLMGVVGYWLTGSTLPLAATAAGVFLFAITAPGRLAAE